MGRLGGRGGEQNGGAPTRAKMMSTRGAVAPASDDAASEGDRAARRRRELRRRPREELACEGRAHNA